MSLVRTIGQNTAIIYTQSLITLVLGAITAFFVIRALERYEFGLLSLAMSIVWMILPWVDLGISQVATSDVAGYLGQGELSRVKKLLKGFFKTKIFLGTICALGVFGISFFLPSKYDIQFIFLLRLAAIIIFINNIRSIVLVTFESHSRFFYSAITQIAETAFKLAVVLGLVVYLGMGPRGVMFSYILSTFISLLVALPFFLKLILPLRKIVVSPEPIFKNLVFGHGKFQALSQPIKSFAENLQIWIIGWFVGVGAVAVFQVAVQIYNYIIMFLGACEAVLLPTLSEELAKSIERGKFIIQRMNKYLFWLSSVAMVAGYAFIPFFLNLLFGDKYQASYLLLYIILAALPLTGLGTLFRPAFFAFKDQKSLLKVHLLVIAVTYPVSIIITALFSHINGGLGFAVGIPLAAILALILRSFYLRKFIKDFSLRLSSLFILDKYDKELLVRILNVLKRKFVEI